MHCPRCDTTWTAQTATHCGSCHNTFSGVYLFDAHRVHHGEHGRCLDPALARVKSDQPMEFRQGMWRGPAQTEEVKKLLRQKSA